MVCLMGVIDDARLIGLIEAQFETDRRGRLVGPGAPAFYLLRTKLRAICRFHAIVDDNVAQKLEELVALRRERPTQWQRDYADYFNTITAAGLVVEGMRAGPLFIARANRDQADGVHAITRRNADLLQGGLEEWLPAVADQPFFAAVVNGRAVALCATVGASGLAHCAGVETVPEYRGRGFASRAVARWAQAVSELGCAPFYATTFDNASSQGIARRLDMQLVGSEFSVYGR